MEIAVGFHSLTTTTHPPNVNLPSSGHQVTARLYARKVSVARRNSAQDPLVRGTLHYCEAGNTFFKCQMNFTLQRVTATRLSLRD
jgi:hypothetical protein